MVVPVPKVNPVGAEVVPLTLKEKPIKIVNKKKKIIFIK